MNINMDLTFHGILLLSWSFVSVGGSLTQVPGCRCFHIFRPVCGDDGRTYGNHCEAVCQGITVAGRGRCPLPDTTETRGDGEHSLTSDIRSEFGIPGSVRQQFFNTDCVCPFSFHPVCGSDGRTYPNHCAATCRGISVEHDGRCRQGEESSGRQCACPPISAQVCGQDGLTYENACLARCRGIRVVSRNPCPVSVVNEDSEGPCACPPLVKPVCAADGETYDNACQARCKGQEVQHNGRCGEPEKEVCICNMRLRPVCGGDGQTYANPCRARCEGQTFSMGACPRKR